jgi:hypothetical protein
VKAGLLLIAVGLAVLVGPMQPPDDTPADADLLTEIYDADRTRRVALIRELNSREFGSDAEQADWHNEQSRAILSEVFEPYVMALAEALDGDTLAEFADELEPRE